MRAILIVGGALYLLVRHVGALHLDDVLEQGLVLAAFGGAVGFFAASFFRKPILLAQGPELGHVIVRSTGRSLGFVAVLMLLLNLVPWWESSDRLAQFGPWLLLPPTAFLVFGAVPAVTLFTAVAIMTRVRVTSRATSWPTE